MVQNGIHNVSIRTPTAAIEKAAWVLLWIFVISIPLEKAIMVPGVGTISRLLGGGVFLTGLLTVLLRRSIRPLNLALLLAAAFVVWSGLSYLWSLDPPETQRRLITFSQLLVMLWLVWELCRGARRQLWLIGAYICGTTLASVDAIMRFLEGQETYYERYAASGFEPNDFGVTVALSIPLGLYMATRTRGPVAWLFRAFIALALCAVCLTVSRTALIATVIAFSFVAVTWRQATNTQRIAGLVLALLLIPGVLFLTPQPARQRIAETTTEITQVTLHGRTAIWKSGLRAYRSHILAGVGSGAYPEAVRPWIGTHPVAASRYVAHNTFLSVLVETGLVGFGIYALLLGVLAVYIWMMPTLERALWAVMTVVWAAGVSTLTWEHRKPVWLFFGLIMTEWVRSFWPSDDSA